MYGNLLTFWECQKSSARLSVPSTSVSRCSPPRNHRNEQCLNVVILWAFPLPHESVVVHFCSAVPMEREKQESRVNDTSRQQAKGFPGCKFTDPILNISTSLSGIHSNVIRPGQVEIATDPAAPFDCSQLHACALGFIQVKLDKCRSQRVIRVIMWPTSDQTCVPLHNSQWCERLGDTQPSQSQQKANYPSSLGNDTHTKAIANIWPSYCVQQPA